MIGAAVLMTAACAFGQSNPKPDVSVAKMTDAEYRRLDDASVAMQKAAEAYRKAADEYKKAKEDVLGKYNALEKSSSCTTEKIVDVRGQFIIVERRAIGTGSGTWSAIGGGGCGGLFYTSPAGAGNAQ
jgi:hypothetical protein